MPSRKSSRKPEPEVSLPIALSDWSFEAIGTVWWIGIYEPLANSKLADIKQAVAERIEGFDTTYSRFRDDSLVSAIARQAGSYQFPADSQQLFALYRELYEISDGLVTPLIGQVLSDAGYDAQYSLQAGALQAPPAWDAVMEYAGTSLTTQQPVLLDFGAAGKGYLVDIVANLLKEHGIAQFCVDAGGDMVCHGLDAPLRIGLEHPDDPTQVIGLATIQDGALCGSAGNRRAWGAYHHIMNPQALISPRHIKALWVSVDTGLLADAIATALFFVPPEALLKKFVFTYVILRADGKIQASDAFPGELFSA